MTVYSQQYISTISIFFKKYICPKKNIFYFSILLIKFCYFYSSNIPARRHFANDFVNITNVYTKIMPASMAMFFTVVRQYLLPAEIQRNYWATLLTQKVAHAFVRIFLVCLVFRCIYFKIVQPSIV